MSLILEITPISKAFWTLFTIIFKSLLGRIFTEPVCFAYCIAGLFQGGSCLSTMYHLPTITPGFEGECSTSDFACFGDECCNGENIIPNASFQRTNIINSSILFLI